MRCSRRRIMASPTLGRWVAFMCRSIGPAPRYRVRAVQFAAIHLRTGSFWSLRCVHGLQSASVYWVQNQPEQPRWHIRLPNITQQYGYRNMVATIRQRSWLEARRNGRPRSSSTSAAEQSRREELAARTANRVVICDTNAFATWLWHRRYMGCDSVAVKAEAERGRCDLYILTGDEIPFVQDGLRDGEHIRHTMHGWFEEALRAQPSPMDAPSRNA